MSLTTLKVFNQYAYRTMLEMIAQQIELFNAATRGAIVLTAAANQGDFSDRTLYQRISGLVRRRDAYSSAAVTAKELTMLQETSVKIAAGTPPVDITPHYWQWIMRSPEEAGVVLGRQLAEDTMADMLNTAIKALVAALSNVAANTLDATAGTPTLGTLNTAAAKFGDRSADILCWIMHSKTIHDLYAVALTNANNLFVFGNIKVATDGFGRPMIITDAADLFNASPSPDQYHILGLTAGAALVEQNPDYVENTETSNGTENITRTWQAQWSYNLGLKGFAWDKVAGGKSPTNAAIGTGTNWDQFATSVKDTAGVFVKAL